MSEEKQMPDNVDTIDDLVKYSLAQDYNKANEVFGNVTTLFCVTCKVSFT